MITREKLAKCAAAVVDGMNLKRGEAVLILGGVHAQDFLEEIALLCLKRGAIPLISSTSDGYKARTFEEIPKDILSITPKHLLAAVKEIDAQIAIEPYRDPAVLTHIPVEKISASQEGRVPIRKVLYGEETGRGKKWTYAAWPTIEAAKFYGVSYDDLERLTLDGMMIPASLLKENCARLARKLRGKDMVRVTDSKGTDFVCKIKDRRLNEDDGVVDDHDIELNDLGNNLPAGELFIAPHEAVGEGTLYCPITIDRLTNKLIKGVTLHFKNGKLLLDDCTAKTNGDVMVESFKRCLKIDKKEKAVRTTNIAELGIGCNPAIDKAIGYILTDEKLISSVHVAFGNNLGYGGTSRSSMHWDFVSHPSATIEVVGTGEVVMKDGVVA
jgi:aminopeptidase